MCLCMRAHAGARVLVCVCARVRTRAFVCVHISEWLQDIIMAELAKKRRSMSI